MRKTTWFRGALLSALFFALTVAGSASAQDHDDLFELRQWALDYIDGAYHADDFNTMARMTKLLLPRDVAASAEGDVDKQRRLLVDHVELAVTEGAIPELLDLQDCAVLRERMKADLKWVAMEQTGMRADTFEVLWKNPAPPADAPPPFVENDDRLASVQSHFGVGWLFLMGKCIKSAEEAGEQCNADFRVCMDTVDEIPPGGVAWEQYGLTDCQYQYDACHGYNRIMFNMCATGGLGFP